MTNVLKGGMMAVANDNKEIAKALNILARHQLICKMLADIRMDISVCQLEGWEYKGYLYRIKDYMDEFLSINNKQNGNQK